MTSKLKRHIILACLVTLLPIPVSMVLETPEGMGGHLRSLAWASLSMVLALLLCVWFTVRDPGNKGRNQKPLTLALWTIPMLSNLCFGLTWTLSMGYEINPTAAFMVPIGLLFAAIGNYLPKCRMNSTLGIKVCWAYTSEENWNATHRFGGRLWFAGGILSALAALLPLKFAIPTIMILFAGMTAAPMVYSWRYYKMQKARGDVLKPFPKAFTSKKSAAAATVITVVTVAAVIATLFAGDIGYTFHEDHLFIEADFYSDDVLYYEDIDSIEYREGNVSGTRTGGYGSFRLLMGFFHNEEFGTYVRYTYYKPESCIVITTEHNTLVLSAETAEETQELYETLQEKVTLPEE